MFPNQKKQSGAGNFKASADAKSGRTPGASNTQTSPAKVKKKGKAVRPSSGLSGVQLYAPPAAGQSGGFGRGGAKPGMC